MLILKTTETAVKAARPGWEAFPWLGVAYKELLAHVARFGTPGASVTAGAHDTATHIRNNPRILEYFEATSLHTKSEDTSWCSAFVNWCLFQSGLHGSHSALARSWLNWDGQAIRTFEQPPPGCIAVFQRPPSPSSGHVAFVWRVRGDGSLDVLGGNQGGHPADPNNHVAAASSRVSISHRIDKPLGLVWPRGWKLPNPHAAKVAIASAAAATPKELVPPGYNH